ncbi:hypothetical protein M1B72_05940 [Geomonas paludis]|uniref:Uncharacterized protein n=1 Tax=Geomonas paludis TaxID=2740185 RepID=A0A6V8MYD7_9BACT|nr:hypothetical protein [Geomonas paludis]UPU37247.1 hypothetical protein M1B72_05940 [Geomonas paludis]GFO65142.1 hypothetical protein GMPD_30610 [Geomonas paludis]
MSEVIYYVAAGATLLVVWLGATFWAVNFFIRQVTQQSCQDFRVRMRGETERALKLFREGLCEQIVQQENKSDALARLYASLIDQLRLGREFLASLGEGERAQAEKQLRTIRGTGEHFTDTFQKQGLFFSEEFTRTVKDLLTQQKTGQERLEELLRRVQREPHNAHALDDLKKEWGLFEDLLNKLMDYVRNEFRRRNPVSGMMMKWLNEGPAPAESHGG